MQNLFSLIKVPFVNFVAVTAVVFVKGMRSIKTLRFRSWRALSRISLTYFIDYISDLKIFNAF